ncbi:hypothetical protein [Prosthecobacter sp.]|uniref:hypothetical protein n=1 Tax=Prosthecobacter sp. TaxID=1965333 RepID=UPI0037852585
MFLRYLPLLALCAPAGEAPESHTSGTTTTPETPEAPPTGTPLVITTDPAPVKAEAPKPGIMARAAALLNGANGNATTIATLRADLAARDTTVATLTADLAARDLTIADLRSQIATYQAQETQLQSAITTLEAQRRDVQTEVIAQLAASGLPEASLPKPDAGTTSAETYGDLVAAAEAETDPRKKGDLMNRALALRSKENARKNTTAHGLN